MVMCSVQVRRHAFLLSRSRRLGHCSLGLHPPDLKMSSFGSCNFISFVILSFSFEVVLSDSLVSGQVRNSHHDDQFHRVVLRSAPGPPLESSRHHRHHVVMMITNVYELPSTEQPAECNLLSHHDSTRFSCRRDTPVAGRAIS